MFFYLSFDFTHIGFSFGGTALFSRFLSFSSIDIILFRGLFAASVLFILIIKSPNHFKIKTRKYLLFMVVSGLLFGAHLVTYFHAMKVSRIGIALVSLFTFPMITTLIEPLICKIVPDIKHILLCFLVDIGFFIIVNEEGGKVDTILGVFFRFLAFIFLFF